MNQKESVSLKGVYTITKAKLVSPYHFALNDEIVERRNNGQEYMSLVRHLNKICQTEVIKVENIIPTVGRQLLANQLTDTTPTDVPYVNKAVLGTGTNTPANADTQLQTETYRNDVASRTNSANIAYITAFFSATETSGTFREAGLFCNGSGTVNTGVLLSRVAINITKTTSESLTIDWTLTIT